MRSSPTVYFTTWFKTADVLSPETFARMALVKPDIQRVTVANSGHVPTLNEPEAAAAIDAFIRRF